MFFVNKINCCSISRAYAFLSRFFLQSQVSNPLDKSDRSLTCHECCTMGATLLIFLAGKVNIVMSNETTLEFIEEVIRCRIDSFKSRIDFYRQATINFTVLSAVLSTTTVHLVDKTEAAPSNKK